MFLLFFTTVPNPCGDNNGNCSHFCLLSSTFPEGYACACPDGLINTVNSNVCKCKHYFLFKCTNKAIPNLFYVSTAPPYLLFSYYTGSYNFIQRSRLDGTERTTLYFGRRPRALSFDFRLGALEL